MSVNTSLSGEVFVENKEVFIKTYDGNIFSLGIDTKKNLLKGDKLKFKYLGDSIDVLEVDKSTIDSHVIDGFAYKKGNDFFIKSNINRNIEFKINITKKIKIHEYDHIICYLKNHPIDMGNNPVVYLDHIISNTKNKNYKNAYTAFKYSINNHKDYIIKNAKFDESTDKNRKDLTSLDFVTIDGEYSRDLDDAIYVSQQYNGDYRCIVSIADVSTFLELNPQIEREALARASACYMPSWSTGMIDNRVSEKLSLLPNKKRNTMSCDFIVTRGGKIKRASFYESIIKSKAKLSYTEVSNYLEYGILTPALSKKNIRTNVNNILIVGTVLKLSMQQLSNPLNNENHSIILGTDMKVKKVIVNKMSIANKIVESIMVKSNELAGSFLVKKKSGRAIYRVKNKLNDKQSLINKIQHMTNDTLTNENVTSKIIDLMPKIELEKNNDRLKIEIHNLMEESECSKKPQVHMTLGIKGYAHFTSPLRRYTDVINHRAIKSALNIKKYEFCKTDNELINHLNIRESINNKATKYIHDWILSEHYHAGPNKIPVSVVILRVEMSYTYAKSIDTGANIKIKNRASWSYNSTTNEISTERLTLCAGSITQLKIISKSSKNIIGELLE